MTRCRLFTSREAVATLR